MTTHKPGTVVYVTTEDDAVVPYIRGENCWYPIAIGDQPYLSQRAIEDPGYEEA